MYKLQDEMYKLQDEVYTVYFLGYSAKQVRIATQKNLHIEAKTNIASLSKAGTLKWVSCYKCTLNINIICKMVKY